MIFIINDVRSIEYVYREVNLDFQLTLNTKTNLRGIIDLNVRCKNDKFNIESYLHDPDAGKNFLRDTKRTNHKGRE